MKLNPKRDAVRILSGDMKPIVLDHPLAHHKLAILRDRETGAALFRQVMDEMGLLLAIEATRSLGTTPVSVLTPLESTEGRQLLKPAPVLVPVLRAGLGLVHSFLTLMPSAAVGHLGLYRDHGSLTPVPYYQNFPPDLDARTVFVLDPMLATGGSACEALSQLKDAGAQRLVLVCLVGAPQGLTAVSEAHPGVQVVLGALDRTLDERGYILPGLGDAGDRLFGTG